MPLAGFGHGTCYKADLATKDMFEIVIILITDTNTEQKVSRN